MWKKLNGEGVNETNWLFWGPLSLLIWAVILFMTAGVWIIGVIALVRYIFG